mmetsp:Transcript_28664/g.59907  ORF Transcript_28664/g.59907 Transcript_28664/m.59907 type:complete len:108 (-) Transcript_28664:144-467(-)
MHLVPVDGRMAMEEGDECSVNSSGAAIQATTNDNDLERAALTSDGDHCSHQLVTQCERKDATDVLAFPSKSQIDHEDEDTETDLASLSPTPAEAGQMNFTSVFALCF